MASVPAVMGEPMVTIKVFYDGATRRGKMPLREMVPPILEQHIRTFLHIPAETETLIERYSDSAAAYVLLDSANTAVYKQLYRAAKAKSKLKFRVTLKNTEEKTVPPPVTVEDESEVATSTVSPAETKTDDINEKEPQTEVADVAASVPQPPSAGSQTTLPLRNPSLSKTYDLSNLKSAAELAKESQEVFRQQFETRLQSLIDRREALVTNMSQQQEKNRALLSSLNQDAEQNSEPAAAQPPAPPATFAVCCNSCERTMPDAHYHCGTCDDGDFDLCQSCVDMGISCYSTDHWLIKRTIVDGHIVSSTTETIAPKRIAKASEPQVPAAKPEAVEVPKPSAPVNPPAERWVPFGNVRTCNACIRELPEKEFLHCDDCEDFDLCQRCFAQGKHGHHPKHRFVVAVADATVPAYMKAKMLPGRNQLHHAICDGCDKYVTGVRHKCLDCPDWDYCSTCFEVASFVHPNHRFAPIYEPLADVRTHNSLQSVHVGICCDGPLCSAGQGQPTYIRGIRYKCAVCHDLDFCANCEACPSNEHNKTHPLIKFKTPVRHVSVTTTGEHHGGKRMPLMGDRIKSEEAVSVKREPSSSPSINAIQTVVDMEPSEPAAPVKEEVEQEKQAAEPAEPAEADVKQQSIKEEPVSTTSAKVVDEESLCAVFVKDSVADGSILPSNHVFEQTWVLRNDGNVSWPAGCSVKFVGGDYMGHVDSTHPADVSELVSASESTICNAPLAPGQEFAFTVLLRTPPRAGKIVSYWRLATPDGIKFGHRLWCDVNVRLMKPAEEPKKEEEEEEEEKEETLKRSNLMFPKLEKESPVASIHMDTPSSAAASSERATETANSEVEDVVEDADWDGSDDGFMTDEEYDILDASDEEYLEEQQKKLPRK